MGERIEKIEIDVSKVKNVEELHQLLKENLEFPAFYGMNWDGFWDAITGLVEMPKKLVLFGWGNIEKRIPSDAKIMIETLQDYNTQFKGSKCEVKYS